MIHELKIFKNYATAKINGDKLFEIRDNSDRGFQKGDLVKYIPVTRGFKGDLVVCDHPIVDKTYEITYVTNYAQKDGYVVFGEREVEE